jgi:two-component system phosphate regulon sensor histidine kinase PhoR
VSRVTLRIIIVLAAASIIGIVTTQVYWVRKAFDLKENQFQRDVNTALQNVAVRLWEANRLPATSLNPVQQVSTNYYVVDINCPINVPMLELLLTAEFSKRNIADFEYGVYDCRELCMVGAVETAPMTRIPVSNNGPLTQWMPVPKEGYYFAIQFPNREANLVGQMGIWIFSSVVLLIVVIFFVYTLMVILRQRRLSEVQKDFINNMTHEFKTPISTIALSAGVLQDQRIVTQPDRLLSYATIIQNETQRLKQQVERVLHMARLEKKELGLKKEDVDVHDLLHEALHNIQPALQEKNGSVSLAMNAPLRTVRVDRLHLTNVFTNLLDNALKYCEEKPLISIVTRNQGDHVVIAIADNGIGIAPAHQKKIFDQFYRVPTGNIHNVKGFGLGLNYVRLMVEAHKGKVSVQSALGKGTEFTLSLSLSEKPRP